MIVLERRFLTIARCDAAKKSLSGYQYQSRRGFGHINFYGGDLQFKLIWKGFKKVTQFLCGAKTVGAHTGNVTQNQISANCCNCCNWNLGAIFSSHTSHETAHQDSNLQEVVSNIPGSPGESFHSAVTDSPRASFELMPIARCDAAEPWQLGSQDAATPMMQGIIDLHHDIFFFLILILVFVSRILVRALWHFHYKKNPIPQRIVHGTTIEILRTIFPSIIPMFIAIPSFALLYSMDEVVVDPAITIKAIGHQWYRTYEYSDYNSSDEQSLTFDSYTIPEDDPELGQSRLLEVDNRVVVPAKTHLRIIVTPADVPHSWAVPSSGVKCDAVPGRLNQTPNSTYIYLCSNAIVNCLHH
ncbi:uncharacterized protein LOC114304736 [Camellia sinensis]|uniref:Cytochrome c oxidase subunit 2 n=1 Tax=Camellia sinensis var. sinensis TaxID=542762 RepID=A0A4S4EB91_CAMSN|nr:uncharacterized protein LOC114304736 [Camellia sinensis]THG12835.1 hypothetical protein TEA_027455 [Camellia sinensis var. sinensis]